jgi:hypothetical protein
VAVARIRVLPGARYLDGTVLTLAALCDVPAALLVDEREAVECAHDFAVARVDHALRVGALTDEGDKEGAVLIAAIVAAVAARHVHVHAYARRLWWGDVDVEVEGGNGRKDAGRLRLCRDGLRLRRDCRDGGVRVGLRWLLRLWGCLLLRRLLLLLLLLLLLRGLLLLSPLNHLLRGRVVSAIFAGSCAPVIGNHCDLLLLLRRCPVRLPSESIDARLALVFVTCKCNMRSVLGSGQAYRSHAVRNEHKLLKLLPRCLAQARRQKTAAPRHLVQRYEQSGRVELSGWPFEVEKAEEPMRARCATTYENIQQGL